MKKYVHGCCVSGVLLFNKETVVIDKKKLPGECRIRGVAKNYFILLLCQHFRGLNGRVKNLAFSLLNGMTIGQNHLKCW